MTMHQVLFLWIVLPQWIVSHILHCSVALVLPVCDVNTEKKKCQPDNKALKDKWQCYYCERLHHNAALFPAQTPLLMLLTGYCLLKYDATYIHHIRLVVWARSAQLMGYLQAECNGKILQGRADSLSITSSGLGHSKSRTVSDKTVSQLFTFPAMFALSPWQTPLSLPGVWMGQTTLHAPEPLAPQDKLHCTNLDSNLITITRGQNTISSTYNITGECVHTAVRQKHSSNAKPLQKYTQKYKTEKSYSWCQHNYIKSYGAFICSRHF